MQSKETKTSDGLVENAGDVVARCHQNHQVPCGELHARRTPRRLPNLPVVGGTCGVHFVQVLEGSKWSDAIRKIAWQEAYERMCTIRRQGRGETNIIRTVEQNESQMLAGTETTVLSCRVRNNSAEKVYSERVREQQDRWDKEAINNVIGVPWS